MRISVVAIEIWGEQKIIIASTSEIHYWWGQRGPIFARPAKVDKECWNTFSSCACDTPVNYIAHKPSYWAFNDSILIVNTAAPRWSVNRRCKWPQVCQRWSWWTRSVVSGAFTCPDSFSYLCSAAASGNQEGVVSEGMNQLKYDQLQRNSRRGSSSMRMCLGRTRLLEGDLPNVEHTAVAHQKNQTTHESSAVLQWDKSNCSKA